MYEVLIVCKLNWAYMLSLWDNVLHNKFKIKFISFWINVTSALWLASLFQEREENLEDCRHFPMEYLW